MEVKPVAITVHAIASLFKELEYHKQNTSSAFANKLRDAFIGYVDELPQNYLQYPECRFIPTKNQQYRNIVWRDYLIIYKILKKEILVLGVFNARQHPRKLKSYRKIK